jgi:transcriptional regulator with XRE-family HTH domain
MSLVNGKTLAQTVRDERQRLGLTQEGLAEKAGIGRETVVSIESGMLPTVGTLVKVGEALGVPSSILLARAEHS